MTIETEAVRQAAAAAARVQLLSVLENIAAPAPLTIADLGRAQRIPQRWLP